jgi:hypothetical protein
MSEEQATKHDCQLPTAHGDLVRQRLRGELEELLACDELWHRRLSLEVLADAKEEADGTRYVLLSGRYGPEQVEKNYHWLLRDLLATGRLCKELIAWARKEHP